MHYLLLTHKIDGGGLQAVVRAQAEILVEAGHDVTVICNKENGLVSSSIFDVKHIAFHTWAGRKQLKKLFGSLADFRVLAHSFDAYWAMFWFRRYKDRSYYFVHVDYYSMYYKSSKWLKNFERTFNYKLLFNGKNVAFVSKGAEASMLNKIGIRPKRTAVIYPPINLSKTKALSKVELKLDLPEVFYISLGRLAERKNVALTIKAFAKVRENNESLVIVGDGQEQKTLKELVNKLGINSQVLFVGWQDNPYPIIKRAQALVMSSNSEGFGLNIVEALSLGVPVVSTDAPSGPREILEPDYADCLSKVNDLDDLVNKLSLLKTSRNQPRFSVSALKEHVQKFDSKHALAELLKFTE